MSPSFSIQCQAYSEIVQLVMGAHGWVARICQPWEPSPSRWGLAANSGSSWMSKGPKVHFTRQLLWKDMSHTSIQTFVPSRVGLPLVDPNATEFAPQWQTCHVALDAGNHLVANAADEEDAWKPNYSNWEVATMKVENEYDLQTIFFVSIKSFELHANSFWHGVGFNTIYGMYICSLWDKWGEGAS